MIWGPWGEEPYKNFFKAIARGWYFHIGSGHYKRSLGYVGNTVHQIQQILLAPIEKVDRKTMYVADDQPADLYDMANMIQKTVGARNIYHVPLWMAKLAARIGDGCKALGWHSVPLTSFRLNNICTEYVFDMQPIMEVSEPLPYNIKTGVEQTVEWLRFKSRVGESGVGESGSRKVRGQKPEVDWPQTHADLRRRFTLRTPQSKRVSSLRETDFNRG